MTDYCQEWTPTRDGKGIFYCIEPDGHRGKHVAATSDPNEVSGIDVTLSSKLVSLCISMLDWTVYGDSHGETIRDMREALAIVQKRAELTAAALAAHRKASKHLTDCPKCRGLMVQLCNEWETLEVDVCGRLDYLVDKAGQETAR